MTELHPSFRHAQYVNRRKIFRLFGEVFQIFDMNDNVVIWCKLKAFKLKEDIRIYNNANQETELLRIGARSVIDFGATYDVTDSITGERLGAFRRKGLKSLLRDAWVILDANDVEVGIITEDSGMLAAVRRVLPEVITGVLAPQQHYGEINGSRVLEFTQTRNPFLTKILIDFSMDTQGLLDRRMGLAASVLFGAIEGKQD